MGRRSKQTFFQRRHTDGQEAMKRCKPSLNVREIKTPMIFHLTLAQRAIIKKKKKNPQTINAGEGVEKREPSYTVDGDVNWQNGYGEQYGSALKTTTTTKLKIILSYGLAIPLLDIYHDKITIQKDTCTPMFTIALFIIMRAWKQYRCSWAGE